MLFDFILFFVLQKSFSSLCCTGLNVVVRREQKLFAQLNFSMCSSDFWAYASIYFYLYLLFLVGLTSIFSAFESLTDILSVVFDVLKTSVRVSMSIQFS